MDSYAEMLRLCRLCLVKDQVSIPIFDDPGDIRQISLKIRSCLPVKVSQDDKLPKKICDGCLNKLDMVYEFWNSTAHAENTLLSRLATLEKEKAEPPVPKPIEETLVKEELELVEETKPDLVIEESNDDETESPPAKRARAQLGAEELEGNDLETPGLITKVEDESDEIDNEEPSFTDVPSTSADDAQPGPSGLGKGGDEAPFNNSATPPKYALKKCNALTSNLVGRKSPGQQNARGNQHDRKTTHGERKSDDHEESITDKDERVVDLALVCVTCDIPYCDPRHLHHEGCSYFCDSCCELIDSKRNMIIHAINHNLGNASSQLIYTCTSCSKEFNDRELLDYHRVTCDNTNTNQSIKELAGIIDIEEKPTIIQRGKDSQINLLIPVTDSLNRQQGLHCRDGTYVAEKPYTCYKCHKCFARLQYLKSHLKTHTGIKPHCCNECEKRFSDRGNLKKHLRLHEGEKPYSCSVCGKRFVQVGNLSRHSQIHTGEKPHVCVMCRKCFSDRSALKRHLRTHNKQFECDYCGFTCVNRQSFMKHLRTVHSVDKRYHCKNCNAIFTSYQERDDHSANNYCQH